MRKDSFFSRWGFVPVIIIAGLLCGLGISQMMTSSALSKLSWSEEQEAMNLSGHVAIDTTTDDDRRPATSYAVDNFMDTPHIVVTARDDNSEIVRIRLYHQNQPIDTLKPASTDPIDWAYWYKYGRIIVRAGQIQQKTN